MKSHQQQLNIVQCSVSPLFTMSAGSTFLNTYLKQVKDEDEDRTIALLGCVCMSANNEAKKEGKVGNKGKEKGSK